MGSWTFSPLKLWTITFTLCPLELNLLLLNYKLSWISHPMWLAGSHSLSNTIQSWCESSIEMSHTGSPTTPKRACSPSPVLQEMCCLPYSVYTAAIISRLFREFLQDSYRNQCRRTQCVRETVSHRLTACLRVSCLLQKARRHSDFGAGQDAFLTSKWPIIWGSVLSEVWRVFFYVPLYAFFVMVWILLNAGFLETGWRTDSSSLIMHGAVFIG